ncbi:hypothetical protein MMC21_006283 [Puttea exsequens]|nr:hypothetical protein [Puttea exsequens]
MVPSQGTQGLASLNAAIRSIQTLIHNFQLALQSPTAPHPDIEDPPNPLALLSDASKILKAQTTKLSLLILNKPFTPSAIASIINAMSSSCLPGLMSALELCPASRFTNLLHNHIRSSLSIIWTEILNLLSSILQDEHGIEMVRRDVLASTGVLWAECDKNVELASGGLVSLAKQRVEENHGLLKDAIGELEDWDPDEDDLDSDTESVSSTKNKVDPPINCVSLETSLESLSLSSMAALRTHTLATFRTIRILYSALQKRRIDPFPNITSNSNIHRLPTPSQIQGLDSLVSHTQRWTEAADEIAGALYDNDGGQVVERLERLRKEAKRCIKHRQKGWGNEEDAFGEWADKWLVRLDELDEPR